MTNIALGDALAKTWPAEAETRPAGPAGRIGRWHRVPDVPEYQGVLARGHYLLARLLQEKSQATYKPTAAMNTRSRLRVFTRK